MWKDAHKIYNNMRRLMYYWQILQKEESELVPRFMSAQQLFTSKNEKI